MMQTVPIESKSKLRQQIVYCSPPMFSQLLPRSLPQWLDYHFYYVGFEKIIFYDAGGLSGPEAARARKEVERFFAAGLVRLVDYREQGLYVSWAQGQVSFGERPLPCSMSFSLSCGFQARGGRRRGHLHC